MRLLILGLDGASFDVLEPMMEDGVIPNIKRLCDTGAHGPMETIIPPVTAPAWLALATGLNPGKTGVFDYVNRASVDEPVFRPISSDDYRGRSVWDYLGAKGLNVGIVSYPTLSPPPEVNGFVVSGMGGKKGNLCHPPQLEDELTEITGGYQTNLNLRQPKYKKDIGLFFEDINRVLEIQGKSIKHLVKTKNWDFIFAVLSLTDWMGHVLWKDIDPSHPLYDAKRSPSITSRFRETWGKIDALIGELLSMVPDDTSFLIVSDHGMGPLDSVFYPNKWLENKGWLSRKNLGWKNLLVNHFRFFSTGSDNKYFNAASYLIRTKLLKIRGTIDLIDLDESLAYSPEHNVMFGCLNLTAKGKKDVAFQEQLLKELKALPDDVKGVESVEVRLPKDTYSGPRIGLSPDIFFTINDFRSSIELDFASKPFIDTPSIDLRTGGHRMKGVFIAGGDGFTHLKTECSILDVAPTILALFGCDVPEEMDGEILKRCLSPEAQQIADNVRRIQGVGLADPESRKAGSVEDMRKMLKSLGYL